MRQLVLCTLLAASAATVHAQSAPSASLPQVEALSSCLVDSTTGRDRKDLAKWIFVAIGAHPEIQALAKVPRADAENVNRIAAGLFTRLITEDCVKPLRAAVDVIGPSAIEASFQVLGQVATRELMTHKDVGAALSDLEKFVDQKKLSDTFSAK